MRTAFTIYRVDAEPEQAEADLPEQPGYRLLRDLLTPLLDGARFEHVAVLHQDEPADMFVDEFGALNGLPRNEAATKIYRNNWLTMHPGTPPDDLPAIYGTAVLFARRVWF
ncbi:hypothetical protein [Kaistia sp. MMO-174]|uniref:hypothetical protein n=1 Tax=Kaistia sp. MMO-174 TaxID=3081256 RepID=UPI0030175713